MGFIEAVKTGIRKTFDFSGTATLSEFRWYLAFLMGGPFIFLFLIYAILRILGMEDTHLTTIVFSSYFVFTLISGYSLTARRLHSVGRSGWWQLLYIIPIVGAIFFIVILHWCTSKKIEEQSYLKQKQQNKNI